MKCPFHKNGLIIIILIFTFIIFPSTSNALDFTYFPEDKTISNDFIYTNGEIFYNAYYFSSSNTKLDDRRNGIVVYSKKECILNIPEENSNDIDTATSVLVSDTNKRAFLLNTMTTDSLFASDGIICNFDVMGNLMANANSIKIFLWVINQGPSGVFTLKGCSGSPCTEVLHFDKSIPGGFTYNPNERKVEILKIKRSVGSFALISLNTDLQETEVFYDTTEAKLYLRLALDTNDSIKLSYFQVNIINTTANSNLLLGSGICSTGDDCLPGYQCDPSGQCLSLCHPACRQCTNTIEFKQNNDNKQCTSCSMISSKYFSGPFAMNCNPIDHVDITSLQNISGTIPEVRYSNGFTMGFWMFISDETKIVDQLINVIIDNTLMISVGNDTKISTICNIYLANYPFLKTVSSMTTMKTYVGNPNFSNLKTSFSESESGKWFYSRCGYSTDAQYMYNMLTLQNNANPIISENKNLGGQAYYKDIQSDFVLRYFYGNSMKFMVENAHSIADTEVFMRNLHIYSNLIPASVSVQYFSWTSFSNSNFPELFIMANFDSLDISTTNLQTLTSMNFSYYDLSNNLISDVQMNNVSLSSKNKLFAIPSTFYRMNFLAENSFFANSDLTSTSSTLCSSETNYCLENSSPINCSSNNFYDTINNICSASCPLGTMPNYGSDISPGTSITTGYCSFNCKPNINSNAIGVICEDSAQLLNFDVNFSCDVSYTKSHLSCYESIKDKNGALLYSGFFNSVPKIHIPVSPSLQNYYFSVWYYVDRVFTPPAAPGEKYYILITSGIRIYRDSSFSANSDYNVEDNSNTVIGTIALQYGQWYRLAYRVSFATSNYQIEFFYNKYNGDITSTPSSANLTLTYISFCNGECESNPSTVSWFTGFYRGLRIWDSTYIPLSLFQSFDQYLHFSASEGIFGNQPLMRFKANVIYYPLHLFGLKDRKIIDPNRVGLIDINAPVLTPSANNKYTFNQWNYFTTFNSATSGTMISSLSIDPSTKLYIPTTSACNGNCGVCNFNECLACNTGFYLSKGVCSPYTEQYYYLFSPAFLQNTSTTVDLVYKSFASVDKSYTVSFFVKLLGWEFTTTGDYFDIIRYGENLAVRYNILTKKLELYTASGVVATYLDFNSLFGTWVHISLGYSHDPLKISYYPVQMNFQVAFNNLEITYSSVSTFNINTIVIPKECIGIYAKLWVWNTYLVGSFANISYTSRNPGPVQKLFDKVVSSTQCVVISDLVSTNVNYNCVMDYNNLLNETKYCTIPSFYQSDGTCGALQANCPSGYFISKTIITDCGCSFKNSGMFIIKNASKNICKKYDYLDFSRYSPIIVTNAKTGDTGYTLEFWVFIITYLPGTFPGFQIKWDKQLFIKLYYSSGSFQSTCYPFYDSSDASKAALNFSTVSFNFASSWAYIRCSVDLTAKTFLHSTEGSALVNELKGAHPLIPATTTLTFSEVGVESNYGLIFFRHIRLWKCYACQDPDTYRTDITSSTVGTYTNMLHLYDPIFTSGMTYITDIKSGVNSSPLVENSNWIGNNIINEINYLTLTTPTLCTENSTTCSSLLKINQAKDLTFDGIEPGRYGRYTLEFWTFVSGTLTNGYHLIWRNLTSVSLYSGKIYCWPQDFRTDISTVFGTSIALSLPNKMYNYDSANILTTWNLVRCAVSYNLKNFYLSSPVKVLKSENIYLGSTFDSPLRYFFGSQQLSSFSIVGASLNTSATIYIRNIYLFNDYIPPTYNFGYLDLSSIGSSTFPSLVFSVSFAKFNKTFFRVVYTTGDESRSNSVNPYVSGGIFNYIPPSGYTTLTLCTLGYKYSSSTCSKIVDCNSTTELNALYCKDEKSPVICKHGFFYNPPEVSSGIGKCADTCNPNSMRSPGSSTQSGICNFTCDSNTYSKCTFTNSELLNLNTNLTCKTGYDRSGYNCILDATSEKSSLYFNGCLNFPNIFYYYPTNSIPSGYFIEFWIKIDKLNESLCTVNTAANVKKLYFLAEPHIIYDTNGLLTYELTEWVPPQTASKGNLSNTISLYNWNHIIISVDSLSTFVKVYSNFNIFTADVTINNSQFKYNLNLKGIGFCANPKSPCFESTKFYSQNFQWGAAFYKNLRIWDYSNISIYGIFDYNMQVFRENVNGLLYDYPLNIKSSLNNEIKATRGMNSASLSGNILALSDPSSFLPDNIYGNLVYPSVGDNDLLYLSSSYYSFDYPEKYPGLFIKSLDSAGTVTSGYCHQLCTKCVSQAICYECIQGYKPVGYYCKKLTGYYLKLPISSSNPEYYLQMNVNDIYKKNFSIKNEKKITFTVWVKMYGQISQFNTTTNEMDIIPCFTIIRLKSDGVRVICYDQTSHQLKFINGEVTYFQDTTFPSWFGQWCMLSFSTFIVDDTMKYNFSPMAMLYIQTVQANMVKPIPFPGFAVEVIDFGNQFSALIADLRIYKDFILNPYGYVTGLNKNRAISLFFPLSVDVKDPDGLVMQEEDFNSAGYPELAESETYYNLFEIESVADYYPFHSDALCGRNTYYDFASFTIANSIQNKAPCVSCSSSCFGSLQSCAGKTAYNCTYSMNLFEGNFKFDTSVNMLISESFPYIDFSRYSSVVYPTTKYSSSRDQTVEFWYYLYAYNSTSIHFDSEEIIWDYHVYVKLYYPADNSTTINVQCAPLYNEDNKTIALSAVNEDSYTQGIGKWNYFTCASSLILNKTYINQNNETEIHNQSAYPKLKTPVKVIIRPGNGANTNYGFLFIKELKFWNNYGVFRKLITQCRMTGITLSTYLTELYMYFSNDASTSVKELITSASSVLTTRSDFTGYTVMNDNTMSDCTKFWSKDSPLPVCYSPSWLLINPGYGNFVFYTDRTFFLIPQIFTATLRGEFLYHFYGYFRYHSDRVIEFQQYSLNNEVTFLPADYGFQKMIYKSYTSVTTLYFELFCDVKSISTGQVITIYKSFPISANYFFHNIYSNLSNFLTSLLTAGPDSTYMNRAFIFKNCISDYTTYNNFGTQTSFYEGHRVFYSRNFSGLIYYSQNNCYGVNQPCFMGGMCTSIDTLNICLCKSGTFGDNCNFYSQVNYSTVTNIYNSLLGVMQYKVFKYESRPVKAVTAEKIDTFAYLYEFFIKNEVTWEGAAIYFEFLDLFLSKNFVSEENNLNEDDWNNLKQINLSKDGASNLNFALGTIHKCASMDKYLNFFQKTFSLDNTNTDISSAFDKYNVITYKNSRSVPSISFSDKPLWRTLNARLNTVYQPTEIFFNIQPFLKEMFLTPTQISFYSSKYSLLKQYILNYVSAKLVQSKNQTSYDYRFNSTTLEIFVNTIRLNSSKNNLTDFYFTNYFKNQTLAYTSKFNAFQCMYELFENATNTSVYDFSSITFVYVIIKVPYNIFFDDSLYYQSASFSNYLRFYDNNLKQIDINCQSGVQINFQLNSNDKDVYDDYNQYPQKYWKFPYPSNRKYRIPFIFPNNTIDTNDYDTQVLRYTPQYKFRCLCFTEEKGWHEHPQIPKDIAFHNGYMEANITASGEFMIFFDHIPILFLPGDPGEYQPLKSLLDSYYTRLLNNRINFSTNKCCQAAVGIFLILLLIFLFFSCNSCAHFSQERKLYDLGNAVVKELEIIENDNRIFNYTRINWSIVVNYEMNQTASDSQLRLNNQIDSNIIPLGIIKSEKPATILRDESSKLNKENPQVLQNPEIELIRIKKNDEISSHDDNIEVASLSLHKIRSNPIISENPIEDKENVNAIMISSKHKLPQSTKQIRNLNRPPATQLVSKEDNENKKNQLTSDIVNFCQEEHDPPDKVEQAIIHRKIQNKVNEAGVQLETENFDDKKKDYNVFFYICKRNIYASVCLTSFFNPSYTKMAKLMLLMILNLTITTIIVIGSDIDVTQVPSSETIDKRKIFGYIISSVLLSNTIVIFLSYILRISKSDRDRMLNQLYFLLSQNQSNDSELAHLRQTMTMIRKKNIVAILSMFFFTCGLEVVFIYTTFMFGCIWPSHQNFLLLVLVTSALFDFFLMEVVLELCILFAYICREKRPGIIKGLLFVKNLRND